MNHVEPALLRRIRVSAGILAPVGPPAGAPRALSLLLLAGALSLLASACATVRPEQRAVLADPTMRFEGEPGEKAALQHGLENREAAYGGGSVRGGGCGCN